MSARVTSGPKSALDSISVVPPNVVHSVVLKRGRITFVLSNDKLHFWKFHLFKLINSTENNW